MQEVPTPRSGAITMIHTRFIAQSILVTALLALPALPAQAHAPQKVLLEFDAQKNILKVQADHATRKFDRHYIERLQLYINGDLLERRKYEGQTDANGLTDTFEIPTYWGAMKVRVRATCNRDGSKSGYLNLPARERPAGIKDKEKDEERGEILKVGSVAPDFALEDQLSRRFTLSDLRGEKNVILIFYAADDSRGGTRMLVEAAGMSSVYAATDTVVVGISPESRLSHLNVLKEVAVVIGEVETGGRLPDEILRAMRLPFNLLVDPGDRVASAYGCEGFWGTKRTVYAIDKEGVIVLAAREMPSSDELIEALGISKEALEAAQEEASKEKDSGEE